MNSLLRTLTSDILQHIVEKVMGMRADLLRKINDLGSKLPPNTLDQLIDELGGELVTHLCHSLPAIVFELQ